MKNLPLRLFVFSLLTLSAHAGTFTANQTESFNGLNRTYSFYIPSKIGQNPALWIMLHPTVQGVNPPPTFDRGPMQKLADANGFIVIWPNALYNQPTNSWYWDAFFLDYAFLIDPDDSGYIRSLILQFQVSYGPGDVFVSGMSSGAFMAERVGVDGSDLVSAVGAASGQIYSELTANQLPALALPVSVILLNGDTDNRVGYCGQKFNWAKSASPASDVSLGYWATANACSDTLPQLCSGGIPTDATGADAVSCSGGAEVQFVRESGVGHVWVPGTETTMWNFFVRHGR